MYMYVLNVYAYLSEVYTWGKNSQGQCGLGHNDDVLRPSSVKALLAEKIIQLSGGWEHSISLTTDGRLYSWGCGYKDNRRGIVPPVLGLGHNEARSIPERITSLDGIKIGRYSIVYIA